MAGRERERIGSMKDLSHTPKIMADGVTVPMASHIFKVLGVSWPHGYSPKREVGYLHVSKPSLLPPTHGKVEEYMWACSQPGPSKPHLFQTHKRNGGSLGDLIGTTRLLPTGRKGGTFLSQSWQGSASAEPSVMEHRGSESGVRAVYVYQPVSNFVSEIKQPRICMLWILICPFRAVTGYEYREQVLDTVNQLCTYIYPLCVPLPSPQHRGPPGLILAKILIQKKKESFLFPSNKYHPTMLWRCTEGWWDLISSLNSYLLWHLSPQVTMLGKDFAYHWRLATAEVNSSFPKHLIHGGKGKKRTNPKYSLCGVSKLK